MFGKRGVARVNSVLAKFTSLADELELGIAEIQAKITNNQERVLGLRAQIEGLKADNARLGASKVQAITLIRNIDKLTSEEL